MGDRDKVLLVRHARTAFELGWYLNGLLTTFWLMAVLSLALGSNVRPSYWLTGSVMVVNMVTCVALSRLLVRPTSTRYAGKVMAAALELTRKAEGGSNAS